MKKIDSMYYDIYPCDCIGVVVASKYGRTYMSTGLIISSCLVITSAHTFIALNKLKILKIDPKYFYSAIEGNLSV